MKALLAVLVLLLILPGVHSQETGLYVEEHNISYFLGAEGFSVEEVITFGNKGDPFTFADFISIQRGDARDIVVDGINAEVEYNYPQGGNTIKFYLLVSKGNRKTITIRYDRSDLLTRDGVERRLNGYALGRYSWLVHDANIRFTTADNYYFGQYQPQKTKTRLGNRETLLYHLNVLTNLTEIRDGFLVDLHYASYWEMAIQDITTAQELMEEVQFQLETANTTLENAALYGDVSDIRQVYDEAQSQIQDAQRNLELAELNNDPIYRNYYDAYRYASTAVEQEKSASKKLTQVENWGNNIVQRALQEEILEINKGLANQTTLLTERLETGQTPVVVDERGIVLDGRLLLPLLAMVVIVAVVVALSKVKIKSSVPLKKGTVTDYKSIDDLKRKTFDGFEKKVDTVKKGVDLATRIRALRSEKEKITLGIENLRKKRVAGEIAEDAFREEKAKFETRIDELDSELITLEEELKELKQVRR